MMEPIDPYKIQFKKPPWLTEVYDDDETFIFESLVYGFSRNRTKIKLYMDIDERHLHQIIHDVTISNPLFFRFRELEGVNHETGEIKVRYWDSKYKWKEQVVEKVNELFYVMDIDKCSTDLEKEMAINEWMVRNCKWSNNYSKELDDHINHSLLGVLLNRKGVCVSFALTATLLLNCFGVECYTMTGDLIDKSKEPMRGYTMVEYFANKQYNSNRKNDEFISNNSKIMSTPVIDAVTGKGLYDKIIDYRKEEADYLPIHAWNYVSIKNKWRHLDVTFNRGNETNPWYYSKHNYFNLTDEEMKKERVVYFGPESIAKK